MRVLTAGERTKRGCRYCAVAEMVYSRRSQGMRLACPHTECPYKVLDKHETYEGFIQSEDSEIRFTPIRPGEGGRVTAGAVDKYGRRLLRTALGGSGKW